MANSTSRSIYLDQTAAEVALEKLTQKMQRLEKSIASGQKKGKDMTDELKKLGETKTKIDEVTGAIQKGLRPSLVQQEALVRQLRNELKRMSEDAPGYAQKFKSFQQATTELNRMKVAMGGVEKAQSSWLSNAKSIAFGVLIGNTVQSALASLSGYLSGLVSGNAKLSDELADIEKASGLSAAQVARLNSELSKIDTRTSTSNLREIAIGLGQIGEAVTAENVAAIDKIVVALGDEFGGGAKEITNTLSILRNNLQDIKTKNYGQDIAFLGNALNTLGAEGLATAPVVVDFANRMAGVASTFKLSSGAILGTAATFQELGIAVERGSTAFIKILQKITAEPEKFAQVAGLSIQEFTKLVNTDLLGAFMKVAEGARAAGKDNVTFGKILKDLDADGSGAGEVLSKVAQNTELLRSKVKLAGDALTTTSSITEEFTKKNTNLAAELEKLNKRITALFTNSGLSNFLKGLITSFTQLLAPARSFTQQFDDLTKKVNTLEKDIVPLLDRYDQLKEKTTLNTTEQTEMKGIIEQVTEIIPGAVSQFDEYGKAIGINTTRVRDFIAAEKARLQVVNQEAIRENQNRLKEIENQLTTTKRNIEQIERSGTFQVTIQRISSTGGGVSVRPANETEIRLEQQKYQSLIQQRLGYNQEIKRLNGELIDEIIKQNEKQDPQGGVVCPDGFVYDPVTKQCVPVKKDGPKTTTPPKENPRIKLLEQLKELEQEVAMMGKSGTAEEIARVMAKYQKLIFEAQNYSDIVLRLETARDKELQVILDKATAAYQEKIKKQEEAERQKTKTILDEAIKRREAELQAARERGKLSIEIDNRNALATARLNLLTAPGPKARLAAQKALLEEEKRQELQNVNLTASERELIEEQYRQKSAELDMQFYADQVQQILQYTEQALNVVATFLRAKEQKENAALQRELRQNDMRRQQFKRLLDQRILTQQEYNLKIGKLQEEEDRKKAALEKRQFVRQQKLQIAMAVINGAMAITSTLAAIPGPFDIATLGAARIVQIGLAIATTAAQIAVISSQKPPQYGKGGFLRTGKRHSEGGMPVLDPNTGQTVAEVEQGEAILSRATVANNPELVSALLDSSMNRGGRRIRFYDRTPRSINYSGINRLPRYETGGVMQPTPVADTSGTTQLLQDVQNTLALVSATNMQLLDRLNQPITASISQKKIDDATALKNRIRNDATFKP